MTNRQEASLVDFSVLDTVGTQKTIGMSSDALETEWKMSRLCKNDSDRNVIRGLVINCNPVQ